MMKRRIAVVGSGISGLGSAWLLHPYHDVVLYEADSRVGGHTNTVSIAGRAGETAVDTGFIVFNRRNYPLIDTLFTFLGVESQPTDMSFGVSLGAGAYEYGGADLDTLFAQRRQVFNPSHWRLIAEIIRFGRVAHRLLEQGLDESVTLGQFLSENRFGEHLSQRYLLPMASAIWSCPIATMTDFPAASLLRFFANHGLLDVSNRPQWRTVSGGSRVYVRRMLSDLEGRVTTGARIVSVRRSEAGVELTDSRGRRACFDEVVMATHADQALAALEAPSRREAELLGAFSFQRNLAVLHTDDTLMPRNRKVWSSWNYIGEAPGDDTSRLSVTYWMNQLQGIGEATQYFVSLNPFMEPGPATILYETEYAHPVFDADAIRAQSRLHEIQGVDRVHFCGAWTGYGFHEDGFRSAVQVATRLGARLPWQASTDTAGVAQSGSITRDAA
jgi:predicted NAD/FAD-binding protein